LLGVTGSRVVGPVFDYIVHTPHMPQSFPAAAAAKSGRDKKTAADEAGGKDTVNDFKHRRR